MERARHRNRAMTTAGLLLCLVLATTFLVCGMLARYTSTGAGRDVSRVAKFDVTGTDTLFEYLPEDRFTLGENVAVTSGGFDQNYIVIEESVKPQIKIGDANGDGNVDVLDAALIQKYAAGKATLTPDQIYAADVNGDNNADVLDAALIQKYAAGKITEFPQKA